MNTSSAITELGEEFYDVVEPAVFPKKIIRYQNQKWAEKLGISCEENLWLQHFANFQAFAGSLQDCLALRYHGHQFQHYNPELGDGRGFLFAQFMHKDKLLDIGTKGSGQTPYSRRGDGRLTLKGGAREILATEYLSAQGVNTSKTFSLIETGEQLSRNDEPSPTRSAVLCRLSHSHIRIGTFQRLVYLGEQDNIEKLLNYCCRHYYPDLQNFEGREKVEKFLDRVTESCAKTCAEWMLAGFVHGVLNTDNINITGESFDYGPFRFLPHYDAHFVAAYFDHEGLYAYGNQPNIIYWNLQQLALCFSHFYDDPKESFDGLKNYPKYFSSHLMTCFLARLNLKPINLLENNKLFTKTFEFMAESKVPFEDFFFDWFGGEARSYKAMTGPRGSYYTGPLFNDFFNQIKVFELANAEQLQHEYFEKDSACSLYIDEIESIWASIADQDDWSALYQKLDAIRGAKFIGRL